LVEILTNGGICYAACYIGLPKREARPLPFGEEPSFKGQPIDARFENILNTHLCHNWKSPNLGSVYVPCNVGLAFVPDIAVYISPAILFQNGMNGGPSDL
jgi:hypothetical protein